jgi:hypothetical protein
MSTISANDLQNTSGGIPTVKGQRLIPTAWVNFDGTGTVAIRDSENVSSIVDVAVGRYTINFSTAMTNQNFSACGSVGRDSTDTSTGYVLREMSQYRSSTSIDIVTVFVAASSGGSFDFDTVSVAIMGGQ